MCGRFAVLLPYDAMARLFAARPANDLPPVPDYNVCPTRAVHVIHRAAGQRALGAMRWGYVPFWARSPDDGPLIINARAESLADKPAFRQSANRRRCLLPASGYFEWEKAPDGRKLPWYLVRKDGAPMAMAGIWSEWGPDRVASCAIVTRPARGISARVHARMPALIEPEDWPLWLGESAPAGDGMRAHARHLLSAPPPPLEGWRVSTRVNGCGENDPALIAPTGAGRMSD